MIGQAERDLVGTLSFQYISIYLRNEINEAQETKLWKLYLK